MTSVAISAAAGTWTLGDLTVNRLGFGAMRLTGGRPFGAGAEPSDRGQAIRVLRRAVELGVNHIDTAAFYFSALRSANELINSALSPYPADLVIVTKVGPGRDPGGGWMGMAQAITPVVCVQNSYSLDHRRAEPLLRACGLAIPGTGNPDHLEENVAAASIELSGPELARLESEPASERPR
jgi:aryl-alcohol dehydrogenase-like predicted oxidoreductase